MDELTLVLNEDPIWNFLIRFMTNLAVLVVIIWFIYYKYSKNRSYIFSFFQVGIMIFMVCFLLKTVDIKFGVALGLFAIFGILRFRSENIPVKSLSYLFTIIGISALNAMATFPNPVRGFLIFNVLIVLITFLLELLISKADVQKHRLTYNKLELLSKDRKQELLDDLTKILGKKIIKVEIRDIDIPKGNADLEVFFNTDDTN